MSKVYEALSNIRHNGVTYAAGEEIKELDDEATKLLLEARAIVEKDANAAQQVAAPDGFPAREQQPPASTPVANDQAQQAAPAAPAQPTVAPEPVAANPTPAQPTEPPKAVKGQPTPEQIANEISQV